VHTTNFWPCFLWLLKMCVEIVWLPIIGWPILLSALGFVIVTTWKRPIGSASWNKSYWLVLSQFLFIPAVAAVGALYGWDNGPIPRLKVDQIGNWATETLFFVSLALGLFWIYRMKGLRLFAFFVVTLQQAMLFAACAVASMSINGSWL
jgi:hypothetical protein